MTDPSSRDGILRRALNASVAFNLGGAALFAFANRLGPIFGLPAPVPRVYSLTLAFLVALFAGTYAWLARQPRIDRPLVAFCAIGKAGFCAVVFICWRLGDVSPVAMGAALGDLGFAAVFAWWLLRAERPALAL